MGPNFSTYSGLGWVGLDRVTQNGPMYNSGPDPPWDGAILTGGTLGFINRPSITAAAPNVSTQRCDQLATITVATCYSAPDSEAEYCDERVCVCVFVCPRSYLRNDTSDLHQIFVRVTYGRGSVLLWRRNDKLCTSGFMDDVIFAHKPKLLVVAAQLKRSAHAALGLVIKCAQ